MRQRFSLLLAFLLVMGLSITAFAAEPSTSFENGRLIVFKPGSVYTGTDLFKNFKDVMPGDVLTEQITIQNQSDDCDYIKVYMRAILFDEAGNPVSDNVLAALQADDRRGATPEIEYMYDFLSQLSLTVKNGVDVIYDDSPDQLDGLADNVYLATLYKGQSIVLDAELTVPLDLGNEYSNRIGEVGWVFLVEGYDEVLITVRKVWVDNGENRPDSVTVQLLRDGKPFNEVVLNESNKWTHTWDPLDGDYEWEVVEKNPPEGYKVTYKVDGNATTITNTSSLIPTGQLKWPIPVMAILGLALIAYGLYVNTKKQKNESV